MSGTTGSAHCDLAAWIAGLWSDQSLLDRYQTLLGALIALGAAGIAARPVWRQLKTMQVQSGTMYRQFLDERLRALQARSKRLTDHVDRFLEPAERDLYEIEEFRDGKMDPQWPFAKEQDADWLADELRRYVALQRDPVEIDEDVRALIAALKVFSTRCGVAHLTHSHDQDGEDYRFSDEEWARKVAEGEDAERKISGDLGQVRAALTTLRAAFDREIDALRKSLRALDRELTRERPRI